MEMLSRKDISIRQTIHTIETVQMPADWLIVSLYPKEREFKLVARIFSMMVFEMRDYFTCLESNLADKIYPYIQQQTMILSKNDIIKIFGTLKEPAIRDGVFRLYLEIDLSHLPIRLIGEDLNDMFGMKIAFSMKCLIVVRHNQYTPPDLDQNPPPCSDLLWYNHEGRFEGIAQKTWSLATFSMMDLGIRQFGLNYHIIGQGDNQVILAYVKMPAEKSPKSYMKNPTSQITIEIALACERIGQDAKPDECLESTAVITYSKDVYIRGLEFYLSLNSISRIFPRGTSDFPTISDRVESIALASIKAAGKLHFPIIGYYIHLNHTARYLLNLRHRSPVESMALRNITKGELSIPVIRKMLILPNILGEFSAAGPINFLYKGGSDPLGTSLSNLRLWGSIDRVFVQQCIATILKLKWTDNKQNVDLIFLDPYGLPLSLPPTAQTKVQQVSFQHVKATTKNKDLKQLMETDIDKYHTQFKATLLSTTPFNPTFLSDVMNASVVGIRDSITKMFIATRTVQLQIQGDELDPVMMILILKELDHEYQPEIISYILANKLRSLWSNLIDSNGIIVTSISDYMPLDFEINMGYDKLGQQGIKVCYEGDRIIKTHQGHFPPFLGTDTREKRSRYG
ncbi:hypothetical protein Golomagni_05070 [Golovinomyces magnicellulatus]|nr:hypothetical protein Golomagni_05070 [Golovinomyces magnicellulatus]